MGTCFFINDASDEELAAALATHKAHIRARYPHMANGVGKSAFVYVLLTSSVLHDHEHELIRIYHRDAGDLGHDPAELLKNFKAMNGKAKPLNAPDMRTKIKAMDGSNHAQSIVVA